MKKTAINGITVLEPASGMYLTNGETCSTKVYLGKNDREADWTEIDSDEAYTIDAEPTIEDYQAALLKLGVSL